MHLAVAERGCKERFLFVKSPIGDLGKLRDDLVRLRNLGKIANCR